MEKLLQRIQTYIFPNIIVANEKLSEMLIELRHRGIHFKISEAFEDGQNVFFAQTVDYPKGLITAVGKNKEDLKNKIKDAIFVAFEIPPRFCNPDFINLDGFFADDKKLVYATT